MQWSHWFEQHTTLQTNIVFFFNNKKCHFSTGPQSCDLYLATKVIDQTGLFKISCDHASYNNSHEGLENLKSSATVSACFQNKLEKAWKIVEDLKDNF